MPEMLSSRGGTTTCSASTSAVRADVEVVLVQGMPVETLSLGRSSRWADSYDAVTSNNPSSDVLQFRYDFQVKGIDTPAIAAQVVKFQPFGDGAEVRLVGNPVSRLCSFLPAERAVPTTAHSPIPTTAPSSQRS